MIAYLPNGQIMSYEDYIRRSDEWRKKKIERAYLDDSRCCICHKKTEYPACHHVNYDRLGHENVLTDIITLCNPCHRRFHDTWGKITGITSQQTPAHWTYYSFTATLQFFIEHEKDDILLGGDYKLTSALVVTDLLNDFYKTRDPLKIGLISIDDVKIFFRNRRLELLIHELIDNGMEYEAFLDKYYGERGKAGSPNELRSEAHKQFKDMATNGCTKAKQTLYSSQYRYIENLWDVYVVQRIKEELNHAET